MPPLLSIRTAQALLATQSIRPSQKHFVFHSSFANKHSMILLVKQPINYEYAHFYFAIRQKTTVKTKDARKIQYNQCHHQYHTSAAHLSIWCTYVPFFPNRYCLYISSNSSLPILSTPCEHYKFFRFTKTV